MTPPDKQAAAPTTPAVDPAVIQADMLALYQALGQVLAALNKLNSDLASQPASSSLPAVK